MVLGGAACDDGARGGTLAPGGKGTRGGQPRSAILDSDDLVKQCILSSPEGILLPGLTAGWRAASKPRGCADNMRLRVGGLYVREPFTGFFCHAWKWQSSS